MRLFFSIGTAAFFCSSFLSATEVEKQGLANITSEGLSLSDLLFHIQNISQQLVDSDDQNCQLIYEELRESLMVLCSLYSLHPETAALSQLVLESSYLILANGLERGSHRSDILEKGLLLFARTDYYEQKIAAAQCSESWSAVQMPDELCSILQTTDVDLVYIQDGVKEASSSSWAPPSLFYSKKHLKRSEPKVLIIKNTSSNSPEYQIEAKVGVTLGGKDHGKFSGSIQGRVQDKHGNYANGKVSKKQGDDGYDCEVRAGKEKKKQ